jgi:hypothetical protein
MTADVHYEELPESEDPYSVLTFKKDDGEAKLKIILQFEGDFLPLFGSEIPDDATEQEARDGFAGQFFNQIATLF